MLQDKRGLPLLGVVRFRVHAGTADTIAVRLSRQARRLLELNHVLQARAEIVLQGGETSYEGVKLVA